MQEYDAALKQLLQASVGTLLGQLTGGAVIARWVNVELPQVQTRRADLLAETASGEFVHIELQSTNDSDMALRMAEYSLGIYRKLRKWPRQIVLYVGQAPLAMAPELGRAEAGRPGLTFSYTLVDARNLESGPLLESEHVEDNVLAILTRLQDQAGAIRKILERIALAGEPARRTLFAQFLILSGLRTLARAVEEEAQRMPILNDILSHEVIGPAILQGREEGRAEGRQEGRQEGRVEGRQEGRVEGRQEGRAEGRQEGRAEGRQEVIERLLERRFGQLGRSSRARLAKLSAAELDEVAVRILDAASVEDVFPPRP